ncbi:MAG: transglycosylase SLT domain-containing protein [Herpetosiphonaceae bacterium]|nr:transglycosylase SLT domain-containing protein [Herpetosiphonaceae bacterium]
MLLILILMLNACGGKTALVITQPTPTAAPLSPAALLSDADVQRELGDVDQAASDYQRIVTEYPQSPEARVARYGLAYSAYLRADWAAARSLLSAFIAEEGSDHYHARALFLLARVAETVGDHAGAVDAYSRYEASGGVLAGYAAIRRAAQLRALDRLDEAAQAYESGGRQPIAAPERVIAYEAAIGIRDSAGQADLALANVAALLDFIRSPSYRPTTLLDAANRARAQGRPDDARRWLREIVEQWGGAPEAPPAIDDLAALGEATAPYRAATIAFSHQNYSGAIALFDTALAGDLPVTERADARRLRALARRENSDFASAQAELQALADEQPDTPAGRQARLDAIQTRGQSGDREGALAAYRAFAESYPDDPLTPEALRRVIEMTSWSGDQIATANAQLALGQRYPWSAPGQQALHEAATYAWQTGQIEQARAAWRKLGDANIGPPRAEGYYWAARSEINLGNQDEGRRLLQAAYDASPNSYYAARAADMLQLNDQGSLAIGAPISAEAEAAGSAWIASWASDAPTNTIDVAPYRERALELHLVDLRAESLAEWIAARDAADDNPHALYSVALAALRADSPYAAVSSAQRLVALAPVAAGEPPVAIRQLLYPTPYATAVLTESQAFAIDPRVLYALMRQESIFNPDATSWVGARGLAQVMPQTGAGIAQNLGIDGFDPDDLYHPVVSIRFGAFYIGAQIERMNGSVQAALAGYNGGPGNAERWAGGNTVADPDLFLQTIDYPETSHYVEVVYANYGAYRRLYGR